MGSDIGTRAAEPSSPPDLTDERKVDRKLTYNLGATGMRGWIHTKAANDLDGVQGRTTTASRQILVTHVGAGTPADGVMEVDDVILGVGGEPFAADARRSIAVAIQEAEKAENQGVLELVRWRRGEARKVRLKLRTLGTYGPRAPYDCRKSRRILDEACEHLAKEPLRKDDIWSAVTGLALLATGREQYLPKVREYARSVAPQDGEFKGRARGTWTMAYQGIFLCEYQLLTNDAEVLPAIKAFTLSMARGQGMYGTFGHGYSEKRPDGSLHGSIAPYGPVNAAGLVANIAIVLGRKCGIDDPEVDAAIRRGSDFFAYYVDKGSIPYGEHMPWPYHENNGKNAMAAILFSLQEDRPRETAFFSKMVTASFKNREYGHTGQGFSYLWAALGANAGGPAAAATFFRESSAHLDLVRRSDGAFTYDGGEQYGAGATDDDTYFGKSGYYGLSPTASYVLTYSLPLRTLLITGRDPRRKAWLGEKDVAEAVAAGHFDLARSGASVENLVTDLGNWSPVVRSWAAKELAGRPEAGGLIPRLITIASDGEPRARQGAVEALGQLQAEASLPVMIRCLADEDRWLRVKAAHALQQMGGKAKAAVPQMLEAVVRMAEPLEPIRWADPIQFGQGELAAALFNGANQAEVRASDRGLLHPAIRAVSHNADGMARATLRGLLEKDLGADEVDALGPDIFAAVKVRCPADTMFGNEIRMGGFKALVKHRFVEGIEAGVIFARTQGGHGSESRTKEIMDALAGYGKAARGAIPALRELIVFFDEDVKAGGFPQSLNPKRTDAVRAAIKAVEESTSQPGLRSFTRRPPNGS